MQAFFSPSEILALQDSILPGMQTEITIYHRTEPATLPAAGSDYGDDVETYPQLLNADTTPLTVMAWLFQTPTPVGTEDTGQVVTVNTVRMFVPLGTPVVPGDQIVATGSPTIYVVADTNEEITWRAWLGCSLRQLEG